MYSPNMRYVQPEQRLIRSASRQIQGRNNLTDAGQQCKQTNIKQEQLDGGRGMFILVCAETSFKIENYDTVPNFF